MSSVAAMERELKASLIQACVTAASSAIAVASAEFADENLTVSRVLRMYNIAAEATPELIHANIAPMAHVNRDAIERLDIEKVRKAIRGHNDYATEATDIEEVLDWVFGWWATANARDQKKIQAHLTDIADDYALWLDSGFAPVVV
jgi:hypothetical protein